MPDDLRDDMIDILESMSKAQLRALRQLRRKDKRGKDVGTKQIKRMSQIGMVYDILQSARRPLHISQILTSVSKRFGVQLDRESVVSALAKRVARKDRFARTAANTFSILSES
jgi:hypothetical protein